MMLYGEAVRELKAELEAARTAITNLLATTPEERQNPAIWFPRVDAAKRHAPAPTAIKS